VAIFLLIKAIKFFANSNETTCPYKPETLIYTDNLVFIQIQG